MAFGRGLRTGLPNLERKFLTKLFSFTIADMCVSEANEAGNNVVLIRESRKDCEVSFSSVAYVKETEIFRRRNL